MSAVINEPQSFTNTNSACHAGGRSDGRYMGPSVQQTEAEAFTA